MTYDDYKSETCDMCGGDAQKSLAGLSLCLACYEYIFEAGGGKISSKACPCCGDYYTEYDDSEYSESKAGIFALQQGLYQQGIGKVTTLPYRYFDFWEELEESPIERKIPALAGKSYAINYHKDGEGLTLFLESKLSPAICEFYLFYEHDFKQSCEAIHEQLVEGAY
jgi:hypothetical protein